MQAARRQVLALGQTILRALNGVQLTDDETTLVSLKHRQGSGAAVMAPAAPALYSAPWRRRRSTSAVRPASADAVLPSGAALGAPHGRGGMARSKWGPGAGMAGKAVVGSM